MRTIISCLCILLMMSFGQKPQEHQRKILFDSDRDGHLEIYVMNPDGSEQRRLTFTEGEGKGSRLPSWSKDGKQIAFSSNRNGAWEIFTMAADGSNLKQLTQTPDKSKYNFNPDWSPDGTMITFDSDRENSWDVYVINSDGTNLRKITSHSDGKGSANPEFSHDGKKIVFQSERDRNSKDWEHADLYTIDIDGKNITRLTIGDDETSSWTPIWSPDGKKILFSCHEWEICLMNSDGSKMKTLTRTNVNLRPHWSPDGKHIVFQATHNNNIEDITSHEIFIMSANGKGIKRLTNNSFLDGHPNW